MARYDFSRLSVLLVEDSNFMRSLFITVLRAIGVERITTAENGEEAIAIMRPSKKTTMVGMTGIDLIISDYYMPVLDGGMFLRWIRRSEMSPDRFLPFIMVSAAADKDVIFEARDAGVDEFLAKPFSAEMLAARISAVVENQRQFIYTPTYFGPDRRRKPRPAEKERRVTTDQDIEIVYSGKEMSALKNSKKKVWVLRLPKRLKSKLATGSDSNEPPFDPAAIEAAEKKITEMEGDYADWVKDRIHDLIQAHHRAIEEPERSHVHMEEIHKIAHELRGQGGMFGYPLMTQFGKSLYECTQKGTYVTPQLLDLINAHIDLIRVVMREKVKGDGGQVGQQLLKSLSEAKAKHAKSEGTVE